jgi:hypothetical protein
VFAAEVEAGRTYPQEAAAAKSHSTASPSSESGATTSSSGHGGDSEATADTATITTMTSESQSYYTRADFEAYFWAADVVVAIGINADDDGSDSTLVGDVEAARAGRSWEDVLVGFYYIKPNYPGRSSHVSDYVYSAGAR